MERYLITGAAGFVGRHFLEYLATVERDAVVLGLDLHLPEKRAFAPGVDALDLRFVAVDLIDSESVFRMIEDFRPTRVLHLASLSSVAYSWRHPSACLLNNTNIFLNVIESIRKLDIPCRILSVGSSEEYGDIPSEEMPLRENRPLDPISPYAVARVSQEMLSRVYVVGYGLDVVLTRSFNHVGPHQSSRFVVASFVEQIIDRKLRSALDDVGVPAVLRTGNLEIVRDFSDVRDVVRAYHALFQDGRKGEVYNVCSGIGRSLRTVVDIIAAFLDIAIRIEIDPALIRPADNAVVIGCNEKIRDHTGWIPEIPLEKTLADMVLAAR
ncbi:MAG TPA: GDP-mannose 4,6-dehydratase [Planctomycetaceae bacterium]|nr:GDP-mannose 4,6-dehydratase [Planctomycetaceae bacterium]